MTKDLERARAAEPHAGKVFAVGTGVAGLPADRYRPEEGVAS
ncbi:hypothetical protein [Amycolatopsis sp. NBRC 101858]|nr:hypothetical protein [Amycolatopsis sp. NBRC 101858]